MRLFHSAGAGHTLKGKYRVYGEGSVHHNGHPCEHGLDLDRHPIIVRTDFPSYWAWLRSELADAWLGFRMRHWRRPNVADGTPYPVMDLPFARLDRFVTRLLGSPYPRYPGANAGLRPEDSIYDRDDFRKQIMPEVNAYLVFEKGISPSEYTAVHEWRESLDPMPVPVTGERVDGCPVAATWEVYER